ncbi:hypothetical protein [Bacillus sp. J14TS2]
MQSCTVGEELQKIGRGLISKQ